MEFAYEKQEASIPTISREGVGITVNREGVGITIHREGVGISYSTCHPLVRELQKASIPTPYSTEWIDSNDESPYCRSA